MGYVGLEKSHNVQRYVKELNLTLSSTGLKSETDN